MIRCQACGTENPTGATYCVKCARKLDTETQESIARRRAEHTATGIRWPAVIAAVLIALVIIVVLALFVTGVI